MQALVYDRCTRGFGRWSREGYRARRIAELRGRKGPRAHDRAAGNGRSF